VARDLGMEGEQMHDVRLGRTDLQVSTVALGTWAFGGEWGAVDVDAATATIDRAVEDGITLFDTAHAYGFGQAERILAGALWARLDREDAVIATKGGLRRQGDRLVRDTSAASLRQGVEDSLRNLRTDHIDLYQLHWPDPRTPAGDTGAALAQLVADGKLRHVGVSNYSPAQMNDLRSFVEVETLQPPYHLFRRGIEDEVLPYCAEHDIGVLVYGPLAHGLLSGRMSPQTTFGPDDWRSHSTDFRGHPFAVNLAVVTELEAFAADRGISLPTLAVAWTLAHPAVDVAIVGARRPTHLDDSVVAADVKLEDEDLREMDRIMASAAPVEGPSPEGM
jgi:aryl-alcohol dehydrogenase-like predicted oxidoreductase